MRDRSRNGPQRGEDTQSGGLRSAALIDTRGVSAVPGPVRLAAPTNATLQLAATRALRAQLDAQNG